MADKVNIGLIGAGRIGRVHAETLTRLVPGARLLAVTDVRLDAARELAAQFGIARVADEPAALLADPDIQAVAICSSTDTHARFIQEAARSGKHIFCEKPIDLDLARIDATLAEVDRAGVKLQVGFNRRFDPNFSRIHDLVASGKLGRPEVVRITSRDPAPPPIEYIKVSGGIFLDMTIHDFDMARYLMGDEVEEVYASGSVLVDPAIGAAGDLDTALVSLRFRSGAIGVIDNSRRAVYGYDQRVEVFGSLGSAQANNNTPTNTVVSDASGVHADKPLYFFLERYQAAYVAEMRAFVDCILNDTTPPVTGRDARAPVVMGLAAWRSCREHRPVSLKEVEPG